MKPFVKARVVRQGKRDGKLGVPDAEEEFPAAIASLKERARKSMGQVVEKWERKHTQLSQAEESARTGREAIALELSRLEEQHKVASDEDSALHGPEQARLDQFQADADELTRRRDAGELLNPIVAAPVPNATKPRRRLRARKPEDFQVKKDQARDRVNKANEQLANKGTDDLPEGIPFWGYVTVLVVLGIAELPLNFLGFRILRERDEFTYLLTLVPMIVLIGGAHLIALLTENKKWSRKLGALALFFSVLFVIFALFQLRVDYIESRLAAESGTAPSAVVTANGQGSPTGSPSPQEVPSSDGGGEVAEAQDRGVGNTGWGFFGLNYGAFAIALALAFVYHGSRQDLIHRCDVAQAKFDRVVQDELDEANEQLDDEERRDKERHRAEEIDGRGSGKLGFWEERQRRRDFEREISTIYNTKMRPIQVKRGHREDRLEQLRKDRNSKEAELQSAANDERQRIKERQGAAEEALAKLRVVRHDWNVLIQEYRRANGIGRAKRAKSERTDGVPRGFSEENLRLEIPPDYLERLEAAIRA